MMNGLASTSEFKRVRWVVLLLCLVCVHLILLDTRAFAQEAGGEAAAAAAAAPEGPPPPLIPENISTHGAEIDGPNFFLAKLHGHLRRTRKAAFYAESSPVATLGMT